LWNILELKIAAPAAGNASGSDIERLEQSVRIMHSVLTDADIYIEAHQDFDLALACALQNQLISTLIDPIVDLLRKQRKCIFLVEGGAKRGQYPPKRFLEAITPNDRIVAREAVWANLAQVRQGRATEDFLA
jgi:DNA-binding FadR family transcriptional regulator